MTILLQGCTCLQVFEYCESDLEQLIKDHRTLLSAGDVKAYMRMVLSSLRACHQAWVLHRDIKPNNFLITSSGDLAHCLPCSLCIRQDVSISYEVVYVNETDVNEKGKHFGDGAAA